METEKKTASLRDVDVTTVALTELVKFIEELRMEFPTAVRVLAKRLFMQEYGALAKPVESDYYDIDDEKIIESLRHLESSISETASEESQATFILSLHSQFGFGKKRVMRLMGTAMEIPPKLSVTQLKSWCEARGIDYNNGMMEVAASNENE